MMENSNSGGVRYKDPEAGRVVRALFASHNSYTPDPRADVIISLGLLLQDQDNVQFLHRGSRLTLTRFAVEASKDVIYSVSYQGGIVFDAAYIDDGFVYGAYTPGDWEFTLHRAADLNRQHKQLLGVGND